MPKEATHDHAPDGVLSCGCTTDVVEGLFDRAGLAPPGPGANLWATIEAHVAPHMGPLEGVLHDTERGRVWADVLVHAPSAGRPSIDLISAGMSARRMRRPSALRRRGVASRAELILRFPPSWADTPTVSESLVRKGLWAHQWLRILARLPHELGVFLGDEKGLPLPYRGLPLPGVRGAPFEAVIVADPGRFGTPIPTLRGTPARPPGPGSVRFLSVVPLFERELDYALDNGPERLFDTLAAAGVTDVVRCDRECVV